MHIPGQDRATPFTIFSSFLLTFVLSRLTVYFFPYLFLHIRGVHIHHFAYGIIIMTIAGLYNLIVDPEGKKRGYVAAFFGIGLALVYDEFGMWLRLQDFYPSRNSYDAIIIISLIFLNIIYFHGFWVRIGRRMFSGFK